MSFDELATQRKAIQLFCDHHVKSIEAFRSGDSYKLKDDENDLESGLHHLTSTATCIESLLECPSKFRTANCTPETSAKFFSNAAMTRKSEDWKSEDSATIYCRCRGLPLAIRFAQQDSFSVVEQHVQVILKQLDADPRFAIGEADPAKEPREAWYPPNAFHTYWTLEVLRQLETKYGDQYKVFAEANGLAQKKAGILLWVRRTLGYQVTLHSAKSSVLDTDQMAWALSTLLRFEDRFPSDLGDQDLLCEALKQLFSSQLEVGTWRHYRSLFHYRAAGNAYCYVYETFAALLKIAVDGTHKRRFYRDALFEYRNKLQRLWQYADSTKIHLSETPDDSSPVGWCSGHRLNQTRPESWATASVFAFAQAYRRLLGFWTRENAARELNIVNPRFTLSPDEMLKQRGNTWAAPTSEIGTVTEQLFTMFINPVLKKGAVSIEGEPDAEILDTNQARSAILFGPPGASKTTLVQAVAQRIGWHYVEIHANHFVADGMQQIHRKADEVFRRLMQLDHAVVLFDEIDELVREREGGHDAFGRFLTTSMLPKLTELWKQRKVIYFVATNHIKYFDRAITRSERFDALILVGQPATSAKIGFLQSVLREFGKEVTFEDLDQKLWFALQQAGHADCKDPDAYANDKLDEENGLAKFLLLRWDQMNELAYHLNELVRGLAPPIQVSQQLFREALKRIADRSLNMRAPYVEFLADVNYPRRDYDKYQVWSVTGVPPAKVISPFAAENGSVWLKLDRDQRPPSELHGYSVENLGSGGVRCTLAAATE